MLIPLSSGTGAGHAKVWMLPVPISDGILLPLSPQVSIITATLKHYVAENARTARRFLKLLHPSLALDSVLVSEIDKHHGPDIKLFTSWLQMGHEVGILSESGCPGIADPGAELVALAHRMQVPVKPVSGPSSLFLALMASGLNGQGFAFRGYLPIKDPLRSRQLRDLEALSAKEHQTQIFIETPYRNQQFLADLLQNLKPDTRISLAADLTGPAEFVATHTVAVWKQRLPVLEKIPMVFLFLA